MEVAVRVGAVLAMLLWKEATADLISGTVIAG